MPLATFQQDDHLGEIVIDSPPQNLYSAQLLADLRAAVDEAAGSDVRALLLRAEGDDFSAGAELTVFIVIDEAQARELSSTVLSLIEAVAGSITYAGGTQRIASRIGVGRAAEMVFTAATLPPEILASWGLINRVVPAASLTSEGRSFAETLANGPTRAYATTKRMLHAWRSGGVIAADKVTHAEGPLVMRSQDVQDGLLSLQQFGPGHAVFNGR